MNADAHQDIRPLTGHVCRGCGSGELYEILSLGMMPPVNAFISADEIATERSWPLDVVWCKRCLLTQLRDIVPPHDLFQNYQHLSSASEANTRHLRRLATDLSARLSIKRSSRVLEIGSNDGTLLAQFHGIAGDLLGVDPALNLAAAAHARGIETVSEFMNVEHANTIIATRGRYDVVLALNVVAHTPDVNDLLSAVSIVLAPGGTFVMEAVDVFQTLLRGEFDTVYHEHVYCFSLSAIRSLFTRAGLSVVDVERIPTQGGSLRVFARHASEEAAAQASVATLAAEEERDGVRQLERYLRIGRQATAFRSAFRRQLGLLKERRRRVVGLGAPARGVVLMNFCEISPSLVDAVIDDTTLKQGRLMPGVHVPVTSWETALQAGLPSGFVLLSWNYEEDFMTRLARAVSFAEVLVPLPRLRLRTIGGDAPLS